MYECPGCGRNLRFDIKSQSMKCEYCDNTVDPYAAVNTHEAKEVKTSDDEYVVTEFTCPQCGGTIYSDDVEAAAFCSYCGASTILTSRLTNVRKPDHIIPFAKTKEDCKQAYKKMVKKCPYAPKEAKDASHIDSFRGIYMPYWMYDYNRDSLSRFKGEKHYSKGGYDYTEEYEFETEIYSDYDGVSFDASSAFEDNLSGAIAPFEVNAKKDFTPAFLSGFYADSYDVTSDTYSKRGYDAVAKDTAKRLSKDPELKGYTFDLESLAHCVAPQSKNVKLAMFPVWFMSYRNKDRKGNEYMVYSAINGQTGKIAADMPVDPKKFLFASLLFAIVLFGFFNIVLSVKPSTMLILVDIISFISALTVSSKVSKLKGRIDGSDDAGLKAAKRKNDTQWADKLVAAFRFNFLPFGITLLLTIILIAAKSIHDEFYYIVAAASILASLYFLIKLVGNYNLLTMRPLPQFNKKGGNDSEQDD